MSQVWQMVIVIALIAAAAGYVVRSLLVRQRSESGCRSCKAGGQYRPARPKGVQKLERIRRDA